MDDPASSIISTRPLSGQMPLKIIPCDCEALLEGIVHLVAVAVALVDQLGLVRLVGLRAPCPSLQGYAPSRIVPPYSFTFFCSSIMSMTF